MNKNGINHKKGFNNVEYIEFDMLKKHADRLIHCFTSRNGGVSSGECESLNLGFNRNDERENVLKNFELIAQVLDTNVEKMVLSNQIHDNRIKYITEIDKGKGILRDSDIVGYDGLITDKKGIALVTFYADCTPVYLFDPVKEIIASVHSGWRSAYKQIATKCVKKMHSMFKSDPSDIEVVIGPSLGFCCFEIGEDIYKLFKNKFGYVGDGVYVKAEHDKWKLNLNRIISHDLIDSGIKKEKIFNSDVCTKCNNDKFFSFRGDKGKTGSLAAIIQLR